MTTTRRLAALIIVSSTLVASRLLIRTAAPPVAASGKTPPAGVRADLRPSPEQMARIRASESDRIQAALDFAEPILRRTHPAITVSADRPWTDGLGRTHVPLAIAVPIAGEPPAHIRGGAFTVHVASDGAARFDEPDPRIVVPEAIPVTQAQARALAQRAGETVLETELVLRPRRLERVGRRSASTDYAPIWEVRTTSSSPNIVFRTQIDAVTAAVLSRRREVLFGSDPLRTSARAAASAAGPIPRPRPTPTPIPQSRWAQGRSRYSGLILLRTTWYGDDHLLCDPLLGRSDDGFGTCAFYADPYTGASSRYSQLGGVWGDGQLLPYEGNPASPTGQTAAVDALWGVSWAWDLLRLLDPTNGPAGDNRPMRIVLHQVPPADIDPVGDCRPGNGGHPNPAVIRFPSCVDRIAMEAPDIVGREFFDIVYRSRLERWPYQFWPEPLATREASAMVLGEMTEFYMRGYDGSQPQHIPDVGGDFIKGGQLPRDSLKRNLFKPSLTGGRDHLEPGTSPGDAGGPLTTTEQLAGVLTRMFFFLSRGAVPHVPGDAQSEIYGSPLRPEGFEGIGNDAATRIWFNAIPYFGNGWFIDVRDACLRSARDTYGLGPEYIAVADAFAAVGVKDPEDDTPPPAFLTAEQMDEHRRVMIEVTVDDPNYFFGDLIDPFRRHVHLDGRRTQRLFYPVGSGDGQLRTGTYPIRLSVVDVSGNVRKVSTSVTVDADAPELELEETTTGRTLRRRFLATAWDPGGAVQRVELRVDHRYAATLYEQPYEFIVNFGAGSPYENGEHLVQAFARDRWGNERVASTTLNTDRGAGTCDIPMVHVYWPDGGTAWLTFHDLSGGTALFEAVLDGTLPWSTEAPYGTDRHARAHMRIQTPKGEHRVDLRCTDRFGNVSTATKTFWVWERPTVTATLHADFEDIVVNYSASDDHGLEKVLAYRNSQTAATQELPDHPRQKSGTLRITNPGLGTHEVCAHALDIDGWGSDLSCGRVTTTSRPRPTPRPPERCNGLVHPGGNSAETHRIKLGKTSGHLVMYMQHFDIPDRTIVRYEGRLMWDTGCRGGEGTGSIGNFSGSSDELEVQVIPNCAGTPNTAWEFKVFCP